MGVRQEEIAQCPPLSPIFGNRSNILAAVQALRFSVDPVAAKFLTTFDALPVEDRRHLSDSLLEAVAVKAKVDVSKLLGEMIFSFRYAQAQTTAVMAMAEHPNVLKASLWYAGTERGVQDRRMLHEAVGFLPTPKGMSLNLNFPPGAQQQPPEVAEDVSPDVNDVFPMIVETEQTWQERRQKLLAVKNA
jgi:hypothetical protein